TTGRFPRVGSLLVRSSMPIRLHFNFVASNGGEEIRGHPTGGSRHIKVRSAHDGNEGDSFLRDLDESQSIASVAGETIQVPSDEGIRVTVFDRREGCFKAGALLVARGGDVIVLVLSDDFPPAQLRKFAAVLELTVDGGSLTRSVEGLAGVHN